MPCKLWVKTDDFGIAIYIKYIETQALDKSEQTALQSPADGVNSLIATASAQTELTDAMDIEN